MLSKEEGGCVMTTGTALELGLKDRCGTSPAGFPCGQRNSTFGQNSDEFSSWLCQLFIRWQTILLGLSF